MTHPRSLGVVGGLGAIAGADLFVKLIRASVGAPPRDIVFEQHPFEGSRGAGAADAPQHARKLYVFEMLRRFEERGIGAALLPCFISHTFLGELLPSTRVAVVDMMAALREHLARRHPQARRVGVLTSDYVRARHLFERSLPAPLEVIHPRPGAQAALMDAVYGDGGLQSGRLDAAAIALLDDALRDLAAQGAEAILPGFTEIPIAGDALTERAVPIIDCNLVYAQYALAGDEAGRARPFKVGVIGGVGPAATVDFMDKIVRNTPARRDQDHVRMAVEHDPHIPDRTEHLVGDGPDPTVALYAAAKRLEAAGADLIAIPCNTAHAFVERIQPYLAVPILNMLHETVRHAAARHGTAAPVGLLATDGTLASRVYHDVAAAAGLRLLVPDAAHQAMVMAAIYGPAGVKAGHTTGACRESLMSAIAHLAEHGAAAVILGCTELPLIQPAADALAVGGRRVAVLDPTDLLARACVAQAAASRR